MKKLLSLFAFCILSVAAFGQTMTLHTHVAINAGQCVAVSGNGLAVPCNNFPSNGWPAVPVGVATTSVAAVSRGVVAITVQYAGVATVPDTSYGGYINGGDLLGDVDGTGNLNDFGTPQGGPVFIGLGPTYVGVAIGELNGNILMVVQPGYIPQR